MKYSVNEWDIDRFRRSHTKKKKYDAILINRDTGEEAIVPFGNKDYEQYKDSTGLGLWSHKDHNDPKRRELFLARFQKQIDPDYWSPASLSAVFLW